MIALKTGAGSFSDALIGALGAWAGCSATLTFDKKAKRLKQFKLLQVSAKGYQFRFCRIFAEAANFRMARHSGANCKL